jgi:hypothetical protein
MTPIVGPTGDLRLPRPSPGGLRPRPQSALRPQVEAQRCARVSPIDGTAIVAEDLPCGEGGSAPAPLDCQHLSAPPPPPHWRARGGGAARGWRGAGGGDGSPHPPARRRTDGRPARGRGTGGVRCGVRRRLGEARAGHRLESESSGRPAAGRGAMWSACSNPDLGPGVRFRCPNMGSESYAAHTAPAVQHAARRSHAAQAVCRSTDRTQRKPFHRGRIRRC